MASVDKKQVQVQVTPLKTAGSVFLTPNTKSNQCVICSSIVKDTRHRYALYSKGSRTQTCHVLEEGLCVRISPSHQNIACRTCVAAVKSALKKQTDAKNQIFSLVEKFNATLQNTRQKYSVLRPKRSHVSSQTPSKSPPKKKFSAGTPRKIPVRFQQKEEKKSVGNISQAGDSQVCVFISYIYEIHI